MSKTPELANARRDDGLPLLASSANVEVLEVLLQFGANPRAPTPSERAAIAHLRDLFSDEMATLVAQYDLMDILRTRTLGYEHPLTRRKESLDKLRELSHELVRTYPHMSRLIDPASGSSVLDFAIAANDIELMRLALDAGCKPNTPNPAGIPPIDTCARYLRAELYRVLVDEFRVTPTLLAATACGTDEEALAALQVAKDRPPDSQPEAGVFLRNAARNGLSRTLRLLIQRGDDVTAGDPRGNTPLHYAAESGRVENVRLLLEAGADPRAVNSEGLTPLMAAARASANIDTLRALLDAAPDTVNLKSVEKLSALDLVDPPSEELYTLLLDYNADPSSNPEHRQPIAKAAERGYVRVVERMIKAGASLAPDGDGVTPLHTAAWNGHSEIAGMLIRAGVDVNARDKAGRRGRSALDLAIARDDPIFTHMLLVAGAEYRPLREYDERRSPNALAVLKAFIGDD